MPGVAKSPIGAIRWILGHQPSAPRKSHAAPGLKLLTPDSKQVVRLSDFRGVMPVALVFGSFT